MKVETPHYFTNLAKGLEWPPLKLLPYVSFRRESVKQTIAGDKSTVRGSKKSSTLLCARKNPKKKKRSKLGSNFNDDGYPLYATTSIDGNFILFKTSLAYSKSRNVKSMLELGYSMLPTLVFFRRSIQTVFIGPVALAYT
jgi:hypothetical protein